MARPSGGVLAGVRAPVDSKKAEEGARQRAEEQAALKRQAEEEARQRAEEEARRRAEEQAALKRQAEEEARRVTLLRDLEAKLYSDAPRYFLEEAIVCFENKAPRAAIVMTWCLAIDHLYRYVLSQKLAEFNDFMDKNKISGRDDLVQMPESKFIELLYNARIITRDIKKTLLHLIDMRNSAAHPSTIVVTENTVIWFVEEVIHNVILKLPI